MAIYHLHLQIISRGKGKSAVSAAAYRSGELLRNEYDGLIHNYTRKRGVVHTEIILPQNAPLEYADRSTLWNAVEKSERYKTAQLAREIEIALPVELSREQRISLVRKYVADTFVSAGMCADICVHDKGDGNPHSHIMLTMRPIEKDGRWRAKSRTVNGRKINTVDWSDREKIEVWRKAWADYANAALLSAGMLTEDNKLDHRSYERQGIDKVPTVHLGVAVTQMERRGIVTERGDINREIEVTKSALRQIKARLNKLQRWLEEESENSAPTLADVLSEMLDTSKNQSRYSQIRDLKMAAKTLTFLQEHNISRIEDLHVKIKSFYSKQMALGSKLNKLSRRMKTLDEHVKHGEIYRKFKGKKLPPDSADKILFDASKCYLEKALNGHSLNLKKWKDERENLRNEMKLLNCEYEKLKGNVREVEVIRRFVEELSKNAIDKQEKFHSHGL